MSCLHISRRLFVSVLGVLSVLWLPGSRVDACTVSAVGVSFGNYNPLDATANDATGSLTIRCPWENVHVAVHMSQGSSGSFSPRRLSNGASTLDYNLYTDSARTLIWGDGVGGLTAIVSHQHINRTSMTWTVYGRIPALQSPAAGAYSDSVTVTIWY